jgi:hypothetical protein
MAVFDAHKNFAWSLVATAPSPASSGTSLIITAGQGANFPAAPFNAVICPAGSLPTPANAEIVRVTNVSTDTFTITRAQESSSARTVVVGDQIFAAITAKTLTDVEALLAGRSAVSTTGNITALALPAGSGPLVLFMTNASLSTIQGIAAGLDSQQLTIVSTGAGQVDFSHLDAGGTALGKVKCFATTGKTSLAAGIGVAVLEYDLTNTRWQLVSHEQGEFIDYSGSSTITGWSSRTITFIRYMLRGRSLTLVWDLEGTSNATTISFTLPFTATNTGNGFYASSNQVTDNGAVATSPGLSRMLNNATSVSVFKDLTGAAWTASAGKSTIGQMIADVQ